MCTTVCLDVYISCVSKGSSYSSTVVVVVTFDIDLWLCGKTVNCMCERQIHL